MAYDFPIEEARRLFPDYTFIKRLTSSAHKAAFYVRDSTGRDLCLKVIRPEFSPDWLDREVLALSMLDHPNVARLVGYEKRIWDGNFRHCIVEEFIPGTDFEDLLVDDNPWDPLVAAAFFSELAKALAHLQGLKLVHRDLKPSNIRVHTDGHPVVVDFGVARHLELPNLTATGEPQKGTKLYFAPEQWNNQRDDIEYRTDLFAFGIMLYQALVGKHPFLTPEILALEDPAEIIERLKFNTLFSDGHWLDPGFLLLTSRWQLLLKKLLNPNLARRPNSADQVIHVIQKIMEGV